MIRITSTEQRQWQENTRIPSEKGCEIKIGGESCVLPPRSFNTFVW